MGHRWTFELEVDKDEEGCIGDFESVINDVLEDPYVSAAKAVVGNSQDDFDVLRVSGTVSEDGDKVLNYELVTWPKDEDEDDE